MAISITAVVPVVIIPVAIAGDHAFVDHGLAKTVDHDINVVGRPHKNGRRINQLTAVVVAVAVPSLVSVVAASTVNGDGVVTGPDVVQGVGVVVVLVKSAIHIHLVVAVIGDADGEFSAFIGKGCGTKDGGE